MEQSLAGVLASLMLSACYSSFSLDYTADAGVTDTILDLPVVDMIDETPVVDPRPDPADARPDPVDPDADLTEIPSECGTAPRLEGSVFEGEVCIPGGDLILSNMTGAIVITLSPYFIDAHEVTNARFLPCYEAGICNVTRFEDLLRDPALADHPVVGVNHPFAAAFCEWDGGRMLPTYSQWARAAMGSGETHPTYPWGEAEVTCDHANTVGCVDGTLPVLSLPGGYTDEGVGELAGNVHEWLRGTAADLWDICADGCVDPESPYTGGHIPTYALAGGDWENDSARAENIFISAAGYMGYGLMRGFRCVRQTF